MTPGEANAAPYTSYLTNRYVRYSLSIHISAYMSHPYSRTINGLIAQANNGSTIVLEHRFFGLSNPIDNLSDDSLQLLTIDQVCSDVFRLFSRMSPVIVFTAVTSLLTDVVRPVPSPPVMRSFFQIVVDCSILSLLTWVSYILNLPGPISGLLHPFPYNLNLPLVLICSIPFHKQTFLKAAKDLAYFAKNVRLPQPNGDKLNADVVPWILIGGSYSGPYEHVVLFPCFCVSKRQTQASLVSRHMSDFISGHWGRMSCMLCWSSRRVLLIHLNIYLRHRVFLLIAYQVR